MQTDVRIQAGRLPAQLTLLPLHQQLLHDVVGDASLSNMAGQLPATLAAALHGHACSHAH